MTVNENKIRDNIIIEEGKPEIDLTSWLNMASNLPEVWQQIMTQLLDNRYGVFTYNYTDTLNREKDGKLIYTKPYSIDLKISIGRTLNEIDGKDYKELSKLSHEQQERMDKLRNLFKSFDEYLFSGQIDIEKIKKGLDDL